MFALLRTHGLRVDEWCLQTTEEWPVFDPHRKALWDRIPITQKRVSPVFPTTRSKGDRYVFNAQGVVEVIRYAKENDLSVIVQLPPSYGLDVAYQQRRRTTLFAEHLLKEWLPLPSDDVNRAWSQLTFDEISIVVECPLELPRLNRAHGFSNTKTRFAFLHSTKQSSSTMDALARVHWFAEDKTLSVHLSAAVTFCSPAFPVGFDLFVAHHLPYDEGLIETRTIPRIHIPSSEPRVVGILIAEQGRIQGSLHPLDPSLEDDGNFLAPTVPTIYYAYNADAEIWMTLNYGRLRSLLSQFRGSADRDEETVIRPYMTINNHPRFCVQRSLSSFFPWETLRAWEDATLHQTHTDVEANQQRIARALEALRADTIPRWVRLAPRRLQLELPALTNRELKELERKFESRGWKSPVLSDPVALARRFGASPTMTHHTQAQRFLLDFTLPNELQPHQAIRLGELYFVAYRSVGDAVPQSASYVPIPQELRSFIHRGFAYYPAATGGLESYGQTIWAHLLRQGVLDGSLPDTVTMFVRHVFSDSRIPPEERWTISNRSIPLFPLFALFHALSLTSVFTHPPLTQEQQHFRAWFAFIAEQFRHPRNVNMTINTTYSFTLLSVLTTEDPVTRYFWFLGLNQDQSHRAFLNESLFAGKSIAQLAPPELLRSKKLHQWMQAVEHVLDLLPPVLQSMDIHALCSLMWEYRSLPVFQDPFAEATRFYVQQFSKHQTNTARSLEKRTGIVCDDLYPTQDIQDVSPLVASLLRGNLSISSGGLLD